jgi:anthranilate synthase component 1
MQLLPSFDRFCALAEDATLVPVWREFLFDVDTAVTAYAKLAEQPFGFLLESVVGGEQWARYSFLGTRPSSAWRLRGGVVSTWTPEEGWVDVGRAPAAAARVAVDSLAASGAPEDGESARAFSDPGRSSLAELPVLDPLADLDARLRAHAPAQVEGLPRFWGGAVGFFSYDVVRWVERLPDAPPDDLGVPDGLFVFTDLVLAIDNLKGRAMAIAAIPVEAALG